LVGTTAKLIAKARRSVAVEIDVVHAHDLDTLVAGWFLAQRLHARLVYDAHELYTGFDPDPPRLWLRAISFLEGVISRRAEAVVTVSPEIADELVRRHRLRRRPLVVLNCPPLEEITLEPHEGVLRVIYQAAAGPGRDLHDLAAAAAADGVEVSARVLGAGGLPEGVRRLEPVGPDEIVRQLVPFDVGLVIDKPTTDNARMALPNKLFEYLMAGLAVIVPNETAMALLVERDRVGRAHEPGGLRELLTELARDRPLTEELRRRAGHAAIERYNAETQRETLYAAWGL
jgi:glycosyltransferase involved in cell wall biosynthesis